LRSKNSTKTRHPKNSRNCDVRFFLRCVGECDGWLCECGFDDEELTVMVRSGAECGKDREDDFDEVCEAGPSPLLLLVGWCEGEGGGEDDDTARHLEDSL
jgi:hypothetical protein